MTMRSTRTATALKIAPWLLAIVLIVSIPSVASAWFPSPPLFQGDDPTASQRRSGQGTLIQTQGRDDLYEGYGQHLDPG